jgi:hypothetical protein
VSIKPIRKNLGLKTTELIEPEPILTPTQARQKKMAAIVSMIIAFVVMEGLVPAIAAILACMIPT